MVLATEKPHKMVKCLYGFCKHRKSIAVLAMAISPINIGIHTADSYETDKIGMLES